MVTAAEKQAWSIYETMVATGKDRPTAFHTMDQMLGETAAWKQNNPALAELDRAEPEVLLAFLALSFDWTRAESQVKWNHGVTLTLLDGIHTALSRTPKPLPTDLVLQLLSKCVQSMSSMGYVNFPLRDLVALLTRDQVSDEIRAELRKLHARLAPSANGKIEPGTQEFRDAVAGLIRVEGEIRLDPGRGPWLQTVFDEIETKEEIARAGWEALLEHCRGLEQTVPGAKWKKRARELAHGLGVKEVYLALLGWLALGPTPGQPPEARSPIEDSAYQKGVVWCLADRNDGEAALAIADFGIACLRKIRALGAVSQKVGFVCVQALGAMECSEAVSQLTRMRAKVKYTVARRLIEKSLRQAAERTGLSVQELEDISVGHYGLDAKGESEIAIGDAKATIHLSEDGRVGVTWRNADGKLVKAAPSHIKKAFPKEVRSVAVLAKELEQVCFAQRTRLESSFVLPNGMPLAHWRKYFVEHHLLGFLGRRLIWVFRNEKGWESSVIWSGKEVLDSSGNPVDLAAAQTVRLWHPLASDSAEVQRWRERIFKAKIRQPFRQAFREFYEITADERETKMYSNRFAKVLMRQHQLASLCRERGWDYRLMGANFDGGNVPTKKFDAWNMRVEFYVDLPVDRDHSLRESSLGEQSGAGINLFIGSDQVRFYRDNREVAVDDVPAILFSEVMRDVDLFTSVCAVGEDETWADQGDRGMGIVSDRFDLKEITAVIALRADVLSRMLPHTAIHDRSKIEESWLNVRGKLGTYRISLAWGGAALMAESEARWLIIPRKILDAVTLDLSAVPIELDYRSEMILRKAHVLADDWKIDSPDLITQLMPK
jgi:hypothetical protein